MKEEYKNLEPHERLLKYEILKRELEKKKLTVKEYDKAIDRLVKELGM